MEEDNILDFNKALTELVQIADNYSFDIWIPSKNKNVKFTEITALQQKDILSGSMDSSIYSKKFNNALYDIIKTNSSEDINEFTILDKILICLQLREKVSNIVKISKNDDKIDVDILPIIEKFKSSYNHPTETILSHNNIFINIYPCLISEEKNYDETILTDNKKAEDIKNTDDIQNIISNAFIGELAKSITNLKINDQTINLLSLTFKQRIRLVEKMPASLIQEILNVVSEWKKSVDDFLTVEKDGEKILLKIDPLFFIG
jgi:hypothetical protein